MTTDAQHAPVGRCETERMRLEAAASALADAVQDLAKAESLLSRTARPGWASRAAGLADDVNGLLAAIARDQAATEDAA